MRRGGGGGGGGGGDRTMSGAVDVFSMYMSSLEVCIGLEMSIIILSSTPDI